MVYLVTRYEKIVFTTQIFQHHLILYECRSGIACSQARSGILDIPSVDIPYGLYVFIHFTIRNKDQCVSG